MEFADVTVKESPGLCRCCLSEGCYKDLGSEYSWMNDTEVYADMLLDCFDIGITQHNDGPNGPKRLICEVCITRLRDACNFKKQVVDSEKKFIDMLGRGEFRQTEKQTVLLPVYSGAAPLKAEAIEEVTVPDDFEDSHAEFLEDIDYTEDDELVKSEETVDPTPSSSTSKRGRPRKTESETPEKKPKLKAKAKIAKELQYSDPSESTQETYTESTEYYQVKPETDTESDDQRVIMEPSENLEKLRTNVKNVVQASTAMPFRWLVSAFRCFYCYDVFHHQDELKSHQMLHDDTEIFEAVNKFWDSAVYIDVSVLNCKLCTKTLNTIEDLIDHLIAKHKIPYNKDVVSFQPFKLEDKLSCAICRMKFVNFGMLLIHTTAKHHHSEDRLCDVCGRTFKPHQMRMHLANEHRRKIVKCTLCDKNFSVHTIRTHMTRVHNKLFKCQMCSETFETVYKRAAHLTTVHKGREPVKCPQCPNTFYFQSTMRRHVKQVHVKEKNVECNLCDWKGFKAYNLKQHFLKKHSKSLGFMESVN